MAIFKSNYTKLPKEAKAYVRYFQHRRATNNRAIVRTIWGIEGKMERTEAYSMIDKAQQSMKKSYFYRIVINLDPKKEDTYRDLNLRQIAQRTMFVLEDRVSCNNISWVATIHDDHTPLRHLHLLAILPKTLRKEDLNVLREEATRASLVQRRELDLIREQEREEEQWEEQQ